ncbi:MAG TPA: hypothetical protein VKX16_07260 [Chloroflexota bacterium]|nr:hypothetical protein [Chloroflexota bacterium]
MASCPFCHTAYVEYAIVGVLPASEHLTHWLEPVPVAQLCCSECGRYTFMHPDHPDVQRLRKGQHYEEQADNVRTLNVGVSEIGDEELREQFVRGREG